MFSTAIKKFGAAVAVATLTLVGWSGSAQAATVVGRWDPLYGAPFSGTIDNMWWSGEGQFYFDDGCVPTGPGTVLVTTQTCGAGNMYVQNASINLSLIQGGTPFASLTFVSTAEIFVARFVDGQLDVVLTDYFMPWAEPTLTNPPNNPFGVTGYTFNLAFSFDGALLYHASKGGIPKHDHGHDDSEEFWNGNGYGHLATPCSPIAGGNGDTLACGYSDSRALVEFDPIAAVPEPQTYALMLAALAALGLTANRRRRQ